MPLKKWQKKNQQADLENHIRRMRQVKPMIDNAAPRAATTSNKKELDRRRQYATIERDNQLLLGRLADVMQKKRIDNENTTRHYKKSLGDDFKRDQLSKITAENYRLLKKIQDVEPTYDASKWEEDSKRRVSYLKNMSEFPEQYNASRGREVEISYEETRVHRNVETAHGDSRPRTTRNGSIRPTSSYI
jgi:hypothetical protein